MRTLRSPIRLRKTFKLTVYGALFASADEQEGLEEFYSDSLYFFVQECRFLICTVNYSVCDIGSSNFFHPSNFS